MISRLNPHMIELYILSGSIATVVNCGLWCSGSTQDVSKYSVRPHYTDADLSLTV